MIVRILGEGQFDVPDETVEDLNRLDQELVAALEAQDEDRFQEKLASLLDTVRRRGAPLADDELVASSLALPAAGSSIEEVRELLSDEGLIPG